MILVGSSLSAQACTDAESGDLVVNPPLPGGGANYPPGTVVECCFTLNEFDTPQANWFHAVIPEMGPGFDPASLTPVSAPTSCAGTGTWAWYDSWVGCTTGQTYGPGFSFDGNQGLGCGGTANDGDPGNNWGDGGFLCANRTFCWEATTINPAGSCNAESYTTFVYVYGDGEAGSWSNTPCLNDEPLCWPEIDDATASVDMPCPGQPFTLTGTFSSEAGCGVLVEWTGPGGFSSNDLVTTATMEGVYTLNVNLDGCTSFSVDVTAMWDAFAPTLSPSPSATYCFGDLVTLTATGGGTYTYTSPTGATFTNNPLTFPANAANAGTWTVTVNSGPGCNETLTTDIIVLPQLMPMATVMPTPVCTGEPITFTGSGAGPGGTYTWGGAIPASSANPYTIDAPGQGSYIATLTITNSGGCSETINVPFTVSPSPVVNLTANPMAICEGQSTTITATGGGTYSWQPGGFNTPSITVSPTTTTTYTVTVTSVDGCQTVEDITIDVQPELAAPQIECNPQNAANITWNWPPVPGADYYEIYIDGLLVEGFFMGTEYQLNGLDPETTATITIIPFSLNNTNCPGLSATDECSSPPCEPIFFFLESPLEYCYDPSSGPILIALGASGPNASQGSVTWSGPGVFPPGNAPLNWFPPGPGTYTLTATHTLNNGSCAISEDYTFIINQGVDASISAPAEVCLNTPFTVNTAGAVNPMATYDWDFGVATVISGSGTGPYELSYPDAGTYTISLTADLNGCISMEEFMISVEDTLTAPVIICEFIGENSVIFGWEEVDGASDYTVNVISGQTGTLNGTTFEVTGLAPGEAVEITVTAVSENSCPDVTSVPHTCTPQSCPDSDVEVTTAAQRFCDDGNNDPIVLELTLIDPVAVMDTIWSGPGVVNNTFDADLAGPGTHVVTVTVFMDECPFTDEVEFTVDTLPFAAFSVTDTVCIDAPATIEYTGMADPMVSTFDWDFDGGTVISGSGPGPYLVSWPTSGSYDVTLSLNDGNCASMPATQNVTVIDPMPAPVVNCINPQLDTITFEWTVDPNATGYEINLLNGPAGTVIGNTYVVPDVMEGVDVTIEVIALGDGPCGNSAPTEITCGSRVCDPVEVTITNTLTDFCVDGEPTSVVLTATTDSPTGMGEFSWNGPGVSNDSFFVATAGVGTHVVSVTYVEDGCSYFADVTFTVFPSPDASLVFDLPSVCLDSAVILTNEVAMLPNSTYSWDFDGGNAISGTGHGPHTISWATPGLKTVSLTLTVDGCPATFTQSIEVIEPLPAPELNCGVNELNSVTVDWINVPGNQGYVVSVNGGADSTISSPTFTVSGLAPDSTVTVSVFTLGAAPCGAGPVATISCTAEPCLTATADFSANTTVFCLDTVVDQSVELMATINGGAGGGTITYSGLGVSGTTFDPTAAGIGSHVITMTYTEPGPCIFSDTFTIDVFNEPEADFTLSSAAICSTDTLIVSFTGSAANGTVFNWDFDGATIVSGSGEGPYAITFADANTYVIGLDVEAPGNCTAVAPTQSVVITEPLEPLVIECTESLLQSVTFSWNSVNGAYAYEVWASNILDTITALSYEIDSLNPEQLVSITVRPLGPDPCGDGEAVTAECAAQPCPDITVTIETPELDFCLIDDPDSLLLTATSSGGDMTGTFTWSGPGVVVVGDDTYFDPIAAGVGTHFIEVAYVETGNCSGINQFALDVFDGPFASIDLSENEVCADTVTTVSYVGTDLATATFDWDFDGATATPLGNESYELNWPVAGNYSVVLTVSLNGCVTMDTVDVEVFDPLPAPVPFCETEELTSITFTWPAVVGATGYEVTVDGGSSFVITETSFTVNDLQESQTVTLTVIALGTTVCGNSAQASVSCTTDPCPDVTLTPSAAQNAFCTDAGDPPVLLELVASGGFGGGTAVWSGTGVVDNGNGTFSFDPTGLAPGPYSLSCTYTEFICPYTTELTMEVFQTPTTSFSFTENSICTTASTVVSFTGSAGPGATYSWDFDGAGVSDLGDETYELDWSQSGTYVVSLTVEENNCSTFFSDTVVVAAPLLMPDPTCAVEELTSIIFEWAPVTGATSYLLRIDAGTPFEFNGFSYEVTDLEPDQIVTMVIVAIGPEPCGNSAANIISCSTDPCPDVSLVPSAVQTEFCTGSGDPAVALELAASGGFGGGSIVWTGTGVVEDVNGSFAFDPTGLAPGDYPLTVTYTEFVCPYTAELVMRVNQTPTASFSASSLDLCSSTDLTVNFNGSAATEADLIWDFAGATVTDLGNNTFELNWSEAGNYTVGLTVNQFGCSSATETTVAISEPPVAGQQVQDREVCAGSGDVIQLTQLVTGADPGGTWSPGIGSPAVVDAASGALNTANLAAGEYTYLYTVAGGVCDDAVADVVVTIQPAPIANAGVDQRLTCDMGMVSLNGTGSTGGSELTYAWTGPDGNPVLIDPTSSMIDVAIPGTYTLEVTSNIGCSATDEVEVVADTEVPVPLIELSNITCFSNEDGTILITGVDGGRPNYNYSLNGGAPGNTTFFTGLDAGEYTVRVGDANGCFSEIVLDLSQPEQLTVSVELPNDQVQYNEGDLVTLTANVQGGNVIQSLIWQPDTLNRGGEINSNVITFEASETFTVSVTVTDENGCQATDNTTIIVDRERGVYIPTGFSPNGDNRNDILFIGANGEQVVNIQQFLVFNRWGESVFENYNFQPNDPAQGWDGFHRGEPLNPAVFVYYAVVEFDDGEVVEYKGDITLIR
ncbi:hypothetical protein CEQ90_10780 [Lewinellaceae bacterium SD302]|nr:hypothetical protein CEQ90_10780 [Lewinellaceae bacterium SD302]